ncbi:anti-sigma factor domain-containing protein [Paenibacillus sp. GCM10027626]|uniref:anti-sigma factor n=1 Tax=Paenibacillus sp. GCM10027626 TaxID=3273411 RepID=UPI003645CA83
MNCYTEEQWADYILKSADEQTSLKMSGHLAVCRVCQKLAEEWELLLADDKRTGEAYPDAKLQQSLRREVRKVRLMRRIPRGRTIGTIAAAGALVLILLIGLNKISEERADPLESFIEEHEPQAVTIMQNPATVSYRIMNEALNNGYIWINSQTKEAFILLEKPPAYDRLDYQAWTVRNNRPISMGLFQIHDGRAHLYVKETQIGVSDNIAVSKEPKGGSSSPTKLETVIFVMP